MVGVEYTETSNKQGIETYSEKTNFKITTWQGTDEYTENVCKLQHKTKHFFQKIFIFRKETMIFVFIFYHGGIL